MSASLQVILVWMLITFASYSIPLVCCTDDNDRVITIDKAGVSSIECCVYGKCHCSNLSLALEHIQNNSDIRIMSNILLQGAINDSHVIMEIFKNSTDVYEVSSFVWLHEFILQFSHIITDCVNNLYGPAQVFTCCDDYSCDESYEHIVDSTHNNITMISNNTVTSSPNGEVCTFQIVATANVNSTLVSTQTDVKLLSSKSKDNCDRDIARVYYGCFPLSCNLSSRLHTRYFLPEGINCYGSGYFFVTPGYWYGNGFTEYVRNCPQGHCDSTFNLYARIHDLPLPNSNDQCSANWIGIACGKCVNDSYIIHGSTSCVPLNECTLENSPGVILFFFISLLYWIIVISLIFVLLHFKFDITAGYAYGILFYYSVLEQTVNASYTGTQNNLNDSIIITLLTILSSIGNMKPPFQLLKLCFWKNSTMMDHMFLTYIHPVIVTSLIVTIFLSARNSVKVARTIGRYVNSKSICILLILSYNSVSYTSVQLLRPLAIINKHVFASSKSWRLYLSPTTKYFDNYFAVYFVIALLCELIIGIAFPFVLAFQRYLTRYLNINFTSIKPIMDQLKGCYKEEYRWFAAYYLLCRQLLYVVDIVTDLIPNSSLHEYGHAPAKFPIMLTVYVLIIMVHNWLQPYKQRILNVLDSCILMTLMLVFIGEHASYGSTVVLWFFPLILFINCVAFSTKFKHLLIPISCLVIIVLSCLVTFLLLKVYNNNNNFFSDISFYYINFFVILPIASLIFLAYMVYLCVIGIKRCCKRRAQYKFINEHNEDTVLVASSHSCILYSSSL